MYSRCMLEDFEILSTSTLNEHTNQNLLFSFFSIFLYITTAAQKILKFREQEVMSRETATCLQRVRCKNFRDFHRENGWRVFRGLYERARLK